MGSAVFFVDIVCHVGGGVDFDTVRKVRFRGRKRGPMGWGAFKVAEEVKLLLVVADVGIFSSRKDE